MRWICALVLVLATAGLFGMDAWFAQLTEDPAFRAFVLSAAFWRIFFAAMFLIASIGAFSCAALVFHPARLSGRTEPGRHEK